MKGYRIVVTVEPGDTKGLYDLDVSFQQPDGRPLFTDELAADHRKTARQSNLMRLGIVEALHQATEMLQRVGFDTKAIAFKSDKPSSLSSAVEAARGGLPPIKTRGGA